MKVLVMTSLYPPYFRGGAELSCQSHAEGLRQRGHNVFILTSRFGIEMPTIAGDVYRLLNYDNTDLSSSEWQDRGGSWRVRRRYAQLRRAISLSRNYNIARPVVEAIRPDVVYVWQMESVSVSPILAAQDLRIPVAIRLPDYWLSILRTQLCLEQNPIKRLYREALSGLGGFGRLDTSHMLPNSLAVMQSYLQAGFPADSMQIIPNGISGDLVLDIDELSRLPSPHRKGEIRLLFAGRVVSCKGPDTAIRALAHLNSKFGFDQASLDIIGEGPKEYEGQLRHLTRGLGLANKVCFIGRIDHAELIRRYAEYDALLLPSRWQEPFSRCMLEAMARGLPVVATTTGGIVEVISDGNNGLLVPTNSPRAMAEAVKRLVSTPQLTRRIRFNALTTVRAKYSLDPILDQVERYLQTVVIQNT